MIWKLLPLIFLLILIPCPSFADDDGNGNVQVDVVVKDIEPGKEAPTDQKPLAGIPEKGALWHFTPKGPFDWISQHPLTLTVLQFPAESAYTLPKGVFVAAYRFDLANVFIKHQSGTGLVDLDMENIRQTLSLRHGYSDRIELAAFIPLQYSSRGFLDRTIESWHGFFGLPTGDRPIFPDNEFNFVVATNNTFNILGESDEFGLGDISLSGKYFLFPEAGGRPAVSVRGAVKLPTGDSGSQRGSGGFDAGVDVLAQKTMGRWILYGQTGFILTGGNDFGLTGNDLWEWSLAGEYQANRKHSWIVQFHHITNPYKTGVPDVDTDTTEMALGWKRYLWNNITWEGGFSEDVVVDSGPDFAVFSQFNYTF